MEDQLAEAKRLVDDTDGVAGHESQIEQALCYASAIAHALIAIAEMLQGSIKAGTLQIDATLWNGTYPLNIENED